MAILENVSSDPISGAIGVPVIVGESAGAIPNVLSATFPVNVIPLICGLFVKTV